MARRIMSMMNSATTRDWLEVTKNQSVSELVPRNLGTESSHSSTQATAMGAEIPVPARADFFGDLKKTARRKAR
jgi:hypothetical protein